MRGRARERLRREAASARRSLGAETIELLRRGLSPSHGISLERLLQDADRIRAQHPLPPGSPTAAELIREDREREAGDDLHAPDLLLMIECSDDGAA